MWPNNDAKHRYPVKAPLSLKKKNDMGANLYFFSLSDSTKIIIHMNS